MAWLPIWRNTLVYMRDEDIKLSTNAPFNYYWGTIPHMINLKVPADEVDPYSLPAI